MLIEIVKKLSILSIFLFSGGCYTQFASLNNSVPEKITNVVDSTGDTVKVIQKTDTILQKEREVCVWERDLLGYPHLRCYKSYYPRDWFVYNNTPWWYRNDPFWGDYDHCPRFYYYDPDCGCCKYYNERFDHFNHHDRWRDHHNYYTGGGISGGKSGGSTNNSGVSSNVRKTIRAKDAWASGKIIIEPTPNQAPKVTQKITSDTSAEKPNVQSEPTEKSRNDTAEVIIKRDIRSLRRSW